MVSGLDASWHKLVLLLSPEDASSGTVLTLLWPAAGSLTTAQVLSSLPVDNYSTTHPVPSSLYRTGFSFHTKVRLLPLTEQPTLLLLMLMDP